MRLALAAFIIIPQALTAQDAESLRARIEAHYAAIHAGNVDQVRDHHLPDITIFPPTGHALMESGFEQAALRIGAEVPFPRTQVVMRHFSAQIYNEVGIATFYLDGFHDGERGTWRVSAVGSGGMANGSKRIITSHVSSPD